MNVKCPTCTQVIALRHKPDTPPNSLIQLACPKCGQTIRARTPHEAARPNLPPEWQSAIDAVAKMEPYW